MRCGLVVLLTLVLASRLPAADPTTFGGTTHFRTPVNSTIVDLAFSPDGKTIVAGHVQRLGLTAWDAATGKRKWTAELNRELNTDLAGPPVWCVAPMHVLIVGGEVVTLEASPNRWQFRIARFRLATGERTTALDLPHNPPEAFRFSPDGTRLAYHTREDVCIIDTKTGRTVRELPLGREQAMKGIMAFSPDGKSLVVTAAGDDLTVFDLATGRRSAKIVTPPLPAFPQGYLMPQYSADGVWLLAHPNAADGGVMFLYRAAATQEEAYARVVEPGAVAAFSPDGKRLLRTFAGGAGAPRGGRIEVFVLPLRQSNLLGPDSNRPAWVAPVSRPADVVAYAPDGKVIAVAARNAVTLLDAATGRRLPQSADRVGGFSAVAVNGRGRVVTLADDIEEWDTATCTRTRVVPSPTTRGRWAALSGNGRFAVWEALAEKGADLELWDVAAAKKLAGPIPADAHTRVRGLTPDGRLILVSRGEEADSFVLRLSKPGTLVPLQAVTGSPATSPIRAAAMSADGRTLVVQEGPFQGPFGDTDLLRRVQLSWHVDGHKFAETDRHPCETMPALAVSGDGGLVALTDEKSVPAENGRTVRQDRGVNLYATRPGGGRKPAFRFGIPRPPQLMAFAPDGRTLAVVMDGDAAGYRVSLYETASGLLRQELPLPDLGQAVAFTPDGSHLVVAAADGPGVIFDLWTARDSFDAPRDWGRLLGADGERAFAAMRAMAARPAATVAFLRDRVKPLPVVTEKQLAAWVADLDAPAFADREAAMKALREVMIDFRGPLEAELGRTPSVEARDRLEKLLKPADAVGGELLRQYRAVEVLARIGTPAARAVLADVATGDPARRLTALAKQALK